ncbi:arylsulfatase B-like [Oscarella lobularis]|uniref:arylsulfatase B-like n=1 Tax=Oscarella lobularis TaxID=121494 RepID=UPI003313BA28
MATTKSISLYLLLLVMHDISSSLEAAPEKPHIFMLLVDDWGWANVGYHRAVQTKEVVTPNFDRLCKAGVELDQHYVHNVCSPTRSSLLSGRLPIHVNIDNGNATMHNASDPNGYQGIPPGMTVIAEKLKKAGYATHQVGKWDAGFGTIEQTPRGRGFDSSFGYFHHANDFYTETVYSCANYGPVTDLWDYDRPAKGENGTVYEEQMFAEHVRQVIEAHDASTPLFLYYAPHIVHAPLQVPSEYEKKFGFIDDETRRIYHAMVNYLDDVVGNVTNLLEQKGMWNNTLMVVSADNGGPEYPGGGANNYPLRGGKASNWQGGVRVNAFVSGGFLPAAVRGTKVDGYVAICDWYATFCSLAGVDSADSKASAAHLPPVDGMNMWPFISGQTKESPRTEIPIGSNGLNHSHGVEALVSGDYKLLYGKIVEAGWTGPQYPNETNPKGGIPGIALCWSGCLFNIKEDPEERNDLASSMPDKVKEMMEKLAVYEKGAFLPYRGKNDPAACDAALHKYGGFWGPWLD